MKKKTFVRCGIQGWISMMTLVFGWSGINAQEYKGIPPQPKSNFIVSVSWGAHRFHTAAGDTWPLTWASDGNLYGSAGDNQGSPMKFLEY